MFENARFLVLNCDKIWIVCFAFPSILLKIVLMNYNYFNDCYQQNLIINQEL